MNSSKLYYNETFSSAEPEPDYVDDCEVEVKQFDVGAISPSPQSKQNNIGNTVVIAVAIFPYSDEPSFLRFLRGISYREFSQLFYGTMDRLQYHY